MTSAELDRVRLLLRLRLRRIRRCDRLLVTCRDGELGQALPPVPSPTDTVVGTGSEDRCRVRDWLRPLRLRAALVVLCRPKLVVLSFGLFG